MQTSKVPNMQQHVKIMQCDKYATTYEMGQACDNMVRWAYTKDG